MFSIVEFVDDPSPSCDVIPTAWFVDDTETVCYWPPYRSSAAINKCVKNQAEVMSDWPIFNVRKMGAAGNFHVTLIYIAFIAVYALPMIMRILAQLIFPEV